MNVETTSNIYTLIIFFHNLQMQVSITKKCNQLINNNKNKNKINFIFALTKNYSNSLIKLYLTIDLTGLCV